MRPWLKDETAQAAVWRLLADAGQPLCGLDIKRKITGWTMPNVYYALKALEATRLIKATPHGRGWIYRLKAIGEVVPPSVRWERHVGRDRRERTTASETTQP